MQFSTQQHLCDTDTRNSQLTLLSSPASVHCSAPENIWLLLVIPGASAEGRGFLSSPASHQGVVLSVFPDLGDSVDLKYSGVHQRGLASWFNKVWESEQQGWDLENFFIERLPGAHGGQSWVTWERLVEQSTEEENSFGTATLRNNKQMFHFPCTERVLGFLPQLPSSIPAPGDG